VIAFCEIARQIVLQALQRRGTQLRECALELISTVQLCACVYENEFVIKYYGVFGFFFALFALVLVHSRTLRATGNPLALIDLWFRGALTTGDFVARLVAQMLGGALAYRCARLFWRLEVSHDHQRHFQQFFCARELQVAIWVCVLHEVLATFVDRLAVLSARQHLSVEKARVASAASLATVSSIGLLKSACKPVFTNPMLGSSRFIGCRGESPLSNVSIYWLGPLIGYFAASAVHNRVLSGRRKVD